LRGALAGDDFDIEQALQLADDYLDQLLANR
jgi:TetR/AcrR family transcriptional repressor of bet genes